MSLSRLVIKPFGKYPKEHADDGLVSEADNIYAARRRETKEILVSTLTVTGSTNLKGPAVVVEPKEGNEIANKDYVLDAIPKAGTGLVIEEANTLSIQPEQRHITSVGPLTDLEVLGNAIFHKAVSGPPPKSSNDLCNKEYVDAQSLKAGLGIDLKGGAVSTSNSQNHITKIGTLRSLMVQGPAVFASTLTVRDPVDRSDASTRRYVDQAVNELEQRLKTYVEEKLQGLTSSELAPKST